MDQSRFHGLEFLVGGMYAYTAFSSCMSSPWTIENVGADPSHAASAQRLINISALAAGLAGGTAAFLDKTWWPLIGGGVAAGFMLYLYSDAMKRGTSKGYTGLNTFAANQQAA